MGKVKKMGWAKGRRIQGETLGQNVPEGEDQEVFFQSQESSGWVVTLFLWVWEGRKG